MPRVIPGPPPGEERSFELPVGGESIRVVIRNPTEADRRAFGRIANSIQDEDERGRAAGKEAIARCFVRVEDYFRSSKNGPVAIATMEDLELYGETAIPEMIAAEIITEASLNEEEKKTSAASSAFTSRSQPLTEIEASPGTADSAALSSSAPIAAATEPPQNRPSSS